MGNCGSKDSGFSIRFCWYRGRSRSGAPASGSSSPQAPATSSSQQAPATSSSQQAPATSTSQQPPLQQASISDLLQGLRSCMKDDVTQLEQILEYIDQALDASQSATGKVPDWIMSNLDDALKTVQEVTKLNSEVANKDKFIDIRTALADVLGGVGNLHWITFGFFMVAFVLRRVNEAAENKKDCLDILKYLRQVGKHLQDLVNKSLPDGDNDFQEAVAVIVEGAILCVSQLDSSFLSRFAFTTTVKGDISTLKEKINQLYPDLNLRVVKDIHRLTSKPLKPYEATYPEHAVGLEQSICDIMKLLETTQQANLQRPAILLHGMGGIGKTTLGEAVCAKMSAKMPMKVAKVEVGQKPDSEKICKCQNDILERLFGEKQKIGLPSDGRKGLADRFENCDTPIFLFIDNVFRQEDLNELLPRKLSLPSNSYVLVTSRFETIAQALRGSEIQWKMYNITGLDGSNAKALLMEFLEDCPADKEQLDSILHLCGGWPLALEVVGSHLRDQKGSQSAWDSAIESLKMCASVSDRADDDDPLVEILRWSYDKVNDKCKNVFLDICCLLRGREWSWVEALGTGSEAKNLRARSMVKKVESTLARERFFRETLFYVPFDDFGDLGEKVQVHDLFVALAERQQESSPNRRVYSLRSVLKSDCGENECEHVEGVVLDGGELLATNLDAMHKTLRILCLESSTEFVKSPVTIKFSGKCRDDKIPSKLQIYSCRRQFFGPYWQVPYTDLSGLHNLRVLNFETVEFDFETVQLPKSLRIFQLGDIRSLVRFHVKAFENCKSLHTVRIVGCNSLREFPASIYSCPIRVLVLWKNIQLENLPEGFKRLESLETFYFHGSFVQELPSGLADLKKLQDVFVSGFDKFSETLKFSELAGPLEHIPLDFSHSNEQQLDLRFGNLHSLRTLQIEGLRSELLSDDFSGLTTLECLCFNGCSKLRDLPKGFQNLLALSKLDLGFTNIQRLPDSIGELKALRVLSLGGCTQLRELPGGIQNLTNLEGLDLSACDSLKELPGGFANLRRLTVINLWQCVELEKLPESMVLLENLVNVNVYFCRLEVQQSQVLKQLEARAKMQGKTIRVERY